MNQKDSEEEFLRWRDIGTIPEADRHLLQEAFDFTAAKIRDSFDLSIMPTSDTDFWQETSFESIDAFLQDFGGSVYEWLDAKSQAQLFPLVAGLPLIDLGNFTMFFSISLDKFEEMVEHCDVDALRCSHRLIERWLEIVSEPGEGDREGYSDLRKEFSSDDPTEESDEPKVLAGVYRRIGELTGRECRRFPIATPIEERID